MLNLDMRDLLSERYALEGEDEFAAAVIGGLSRPQKTLPCRYFYDARGSELFEEITRLPEYYPTRTEAAILEAHAGEMAAGVPRGGALVEFGSGSSLKTEILLKHLPQLGCYVSIDVSASALEDAAAAARGALPDPRCPADRRRLLLSHRASGRRCGAPQDRLLPRLHHRQLHAGRGAAPARASSAPPCRRAAG